ncbi:MAG: ABC transporter substrate-binding protein [Hyphomicrobiales bacterium]
MRLAKKPFIPLLVAGALMTGGVASAKTFIHCSEASPQGFDTALYDGSETLDYGPNIYNGLVRFTFGTTDIAPDLAQSWDISDGGKTIVFHLRKGIKFHKTDWFTPTRDFNADDVIFSLMRQKEENNPYHNYAGPYLYFNAMGMPDLIKDIVKLDDYTVKLVLTKPDAAILPDLKMEFALILSKEYADQLLKAGTPELLNRKPVGTGPFQFVAYKKDAFVRMKANPDYYRGKQPIDNLVFAITPDASVRYQKLKKNECQTMPFPNLADLDAMKNDPNLKVMEWPGLNVGYLAYNTRRKPFDDVRVRKALNMAIDKKAIIKAVFHGEGTIAKNPMPPTVWGYNDEVKDDPYDPQAAKALLKEAGVSKLKMKLWAMPVQRPYNPNARRMAELIKADWAKISVRAEIVTYEWGEYLKRSRAVDRDGAVLLGWTSDNGDPDNFLGTLLDCDAVGSNNMAQWCYGPYEALIQKAKTLVGQRDKRAELYRQAQVIFKAQAPWATIAHSKVHVPMRKNVMGYHKDPLDRHDFEGVDLVE